MLPQVLCQLDFPKFYPRNSLEIKALLLLINTIRKTQSVFPLYRFKATVSFCDCIKSAYTGAADTNFQVVQ